MALNSKIGAALGSVLLGAVGLARASDPYGVLPFGDPAHPPPFRALSAQEEVQVNAGRALFATRFESGRGSTGEHVGLGPLFNAQSCDECHQAGRRGEGPKGEGLAPTSLVIQLESQGGSSHGLGDPVYGRVLNTRAIEGLKPEGVVHIEYSELSGYYYPFGPWWSMRSPHYRIDGLTHGAIADSTVIRPRLAPQLYGLGLLELVPDAEASTAYGAPRRYAGRAMPGRMGWQGDAVSIRDQSTRAFAREIGLTSPDQPLDDCTPKESECQGKAGNPPELSDQLVESVTSFVRTLAVPAAPSKAKEHARGASLFMETGCAECHVPRTEISVARADGVRESKTIAPFTDLRLHDLGPEMADETVAGNKVSTRWRTAPLWGLGFRAQTEHSPTYLHDGRARSTEEAILWHFGEAGHARYRFMELGPNARDALLKWLDTL
jgi:CxxC motif-containing protein (DUF1111 family)